MFEIATGNIPDIENRKITFSHGKRNRQRRPDKTLDKLDIKLKTWEAEEPHGEIEKSK